MKVADYIKGICKFDYYRNGFLFYKTENDFLFRVPISDTGDGTFKNEDKGIYFMRYIRKELKGIEDGNKTD